MRKEQQKGRSGGKMRSTAVNTQPIVVAGIGVGAGGSGSLKRLLSSLSSGQDTAYLLIRHPETAGKNLTVKQLAGLTGLTVVEAADEMPVLADRLHVVPADRLLSMEGGKLTLKQPVQCNGLWMPIDHFFCSLAAERGKQSCGILLAGRGSDGTLGLSEIRAAGGATIVEEPKNAKHSGMSQSAIDAGVAGSVLPVEFIAGKIAELTKRVRAQARKEQTVFPKLDPDLRPVLDILRIQAGHDFLCYKPNTLIRRIHRRMSLAKITATADYARFLGENPDEIGRLQKDLQIGVTEFFRQPQAWEVLEQKVIIPLINNAQPGADIRVWVPGCSTGQEAYSLAMMLTEQVRKSGKDIGIQIFATDSEIAALAVARAGSYSKEDIAGVVPPGYLKRFFTPKDGRFQISKDIRERIVFAPQNITADPPFSRLDLISCRNLLMYLEQQVQQKIFAVFHFALHEGGFLFLGSAETIGERTDLFEPVSQKWRIYRRIGVGRSLGIEIPVHPIGISQGMPARIPIAPSPRITLTSTAQQVLMDRFAPTCVMIDRKLQVLYVHGAIEEYLTFPAGELSMSIVDMAREGLRARLRGAIDKCISTGRSVPIAARVRRQNKSIPVKATVSPLRYPRSADGLLLVTFEDQHLPAVKLKQHLAQDSDIRQMEDELKITREELQSTIEQLEGSNDQLKASNEEVTAANEELQAANEELETSKEELQSLNEELNTSNTHLHEKVEEQERTNNDIVNLLSSTAIATLFLDKELRIKRFTPAITDLFSLIPSDTGRPIADVLHRFTDEDLLGDARRVLAVLTPAAREVQADDGRCYMRRITPYRTQDDRIEGVVITFVDFTERKRAEDALNETRLRQAVILDSIADGFFALDRNWRFIHVNDPALNHFAKKRDELVGRKLFDVFPTFRGSIFESEYRHAMEAGEPACFETQSLIGDRIMEIYAYPGADNLVVLFRDVTQRHYLAHALKEAHDRADWLARFPEENPHPVVRAAADGNILYCNPASAADSAWGCKEGNLLPEVFLPLAALALTKKEEVHQEVRLGEKFYGVTITPFPQDSYANIYGREITKRRQAEEELRRRELLYRELVQNAASAIIRWRKDGTITFFNEFAQNFFGYRQDEVIGKHINILIPERESTGADLSDLAENILAHPDRYTNNINENIRKDGSRIWMTWTNRPIMDDDGRVTEILAVGSDITENKRMEQALQESEQRVRLKLESILSPAGDIGNLELSDIIDVETVRSMMVDFSALTNIAVAFIDLRGKVLVGEAWRDICTNFHRVHQESCRHCIESDTQLTTGILPGQSRLYRCKNNMWDIATPITVAGKHIGNVFTGQFFFEDEPVDYELFREQARQYGFDEDTYIRALDAVPRLSRESVDRAISFLRQLAQTLSQLSYSNIRLARSLTERDTLMNSLRKSEERYRNLVKYAPAAIYETDLQAARFLSINEVMCNILGYSQEELLAMKPADLLSRESRLVFRERIEKMLAQKKPGDPVECRMRRKDGVWIDTVISVGETFSSNEESSGVVVIAYDVTERKRIEEAVHRSEERLRRAQEIAHLGSWELDLVNNNRLSWSDEIYRIFGVKPQEFDATYEAFLEHIHPGDRDAVNAAYTGSLKENRDQYEIEHRIVRRDTGEIHIVQERCHHIRDKSGTIIRSVGMVHDITERKQAEAALLKKTEQLEAANKELESFSYTVSHDLRAPLRAIDGYSRMILKRHADKFDDDALGKFNVIRDNTRMMGQLIDDLLAFSRLGRAPLAKAKLDMNVMIRDVWKDMNIDDTERRIDLRITEIPQGFGDQGLIRQVLTNMLANAVKFTKVKENALIEAGGYGKGGENVYYIRDNGAGFDMQYYHKLFGVFQRLHHTDDFEGTGVGLAIVQRIIHKHGGRVWAEGKVNEGACFYFSLPE